MIWFDEMALECPAFPDRRSEAMFRHVACLVAFWALAPAAHAERDGLLAAHNDLRARHGVPPLAWSQSLAKSAQEWAATCIFEHSTGDYGENLSWWRGGNQTPADRVRDWYAEIKDFNFAAPERNDYQVTGHFTQIVWRAAREVGCGVAVCADGAIILVCRYAPAGNVRGRYGENVPPPVSR
jgi:hypothetical protein